ncbi:MAG TPA: hypothetical protein VFP61_00400 [Acidimicrobiales bacterium]|nr:hypothetical protein [Acidimicrobiales bacterium]
MSRWDAADDVLLSFEEARVTLLSVLDAADAAPAGTELRLRLEAVGRMLSAKLFPDYPHGGGAVP